MLHRFYAVIWMFSLLLQCSTVQADERIISFHSAIQVYADRSVIITETIRVRAEGNKISRGIYRDFPTRYQDSYGNIQRVEFQLLSVKRDGKTESYHQEAVTNGVRTYIGKRNFYLPRGEYNYEITYRSTNQLGLFDDYDELYWNVTGNGWEFTIDKVSAEVILPRTVAGTALRLFAYTGHDGSKGGDFKAEISAQGHAYFTTTRPLAEYEGLTIAVGWPKGIVLAPASEEQRDEFIRENKTGLINLLILTILFMYYIIVWRKVGRDPARGVIIPLYAPPKGFSPASVRYINRMGYDDKTFSTAIINLSVKGYIRIDKDDTDYRLTRTEPKHELELAAGEKVLLIRLFKHSDSIELNKNITEAERNALNMAESAHRMSLKLNYNKLYFRSNSGWIATGIVLTLVMLISMFVTTANNEARFHIIWTGIWSFGVFALTWQVYKAWYGVLKSASGTAAAVFLSVFSLPLWGAEMFGLFMLAKHISLLALASLVAAVFVNVGFIEWLKAPTLAGRKLLDKLEGFRDYLEIAEKDEMNLRNPPEKLPELFEVYLPYAIALDVEQKWAEKFSSVFAKLERDGRKYAPGWYHGDDFSVSGFGSFADKFSSSVSSAATPPGSSSGSGGGGSSGGGGGGGGGGGW